MTARGEKWVRIVLAGPWTLVASFVVMASLATWLPDGKARVDNLIVPLVAYPLIWGVLFFHAVLAKNLWRAVSVNFALTAVCAVLLVQHFVAVSGG